MRFLGSVRTLDAATIARFTQIDYDREMALIALATEGGVEREVGVCRYFSLPDGASCEYAIVVADAYQGRGLGRAMLSLLARIARDQGLGHHGGHRPFGQRRDAGAVRVRSGSRAGPTPTTRRSCSCGSSLPASFAR
jgi:GNAT superfamily N-acetyltransferase